MPEAALTHPPLSAWGPAAAGALCAALVLLAAWLGRGRRRAAPTLPRRPRPQARPPRGGPERRSAPRRRGGGVGVLLSDASARHEPVRGMLLDRSTGGLAVAAGLGVPAGAVLSVRVERHARDMPWVRVRVRSCRREGARWVLGCQFLEPPPWGVLLLFA